MSQPIRFGVIGTSGHGNRVAAPNIVANPAAQLIGGVGTSLERSQAFAKAHGAKKSYESVDQMLADPDIDAVWICSPNSRHGADVIRAVQAAKHVLVEKPLGLAAAEAAEAAKAAAAAGRILRVGYQHRYRPSHRYIKDLIETGHIGKLGYVRLHRFWLYPYYPDMPAEPPAWRQDPAISGGFIINDLGSHLIDMAQWFGGSHGRFIGAAMGSQKFDFRTEDSVAVMMGLGDAVIGLVEASNSNVSPGSRFEFYGSKGWIRAEDTLALDASSTVTTHDGIVREFEQLDHLVPYGLQVGDFIEAIRGNPSFGATGEDGAANAGIIEAARSHGARLQREGFTAR
tara:strand:- start:8452 stop:9477 length:1026 start_codon:yes stop_codon:yes gene_type:complete